MHLHPLLRHVQYELSDQELGGFLAVTLRVRGSEGQVPLARNNFFNILGTSHIPNHQCRSDNPRHKEETHIPCCHNGRHRLSPFELWSMERL